MKTCWLLIFIVMSVGSTQVLAKECANCTGHKAKKSAPVILDSTKDLVDEIARHMPPEASMKIPTTKEWDLTNTDVLSKSSKEADRIKAAKMLLDYMERLSPCRYSDGVERIRTIYDRLIADEVPEVRREMFKLLSSQENRVWAITCLNGLTEKGVVASRDFVKAFLEGRLGGERLTFLEDRIRHSLLSSLIKQEIPQEYRARIESLYRQDVRKKHDETLAFLQSERRKYSVKGSKNPVRMAIYPGMPARVELKSRCGNFSIGINFIDEQMMDVTIKRSWHPETLESAIFNEELPGKLSGNVMHLHNSVRDLCKHAYKRAGNIRKHLADNRLRKSEPSVLKPETIRNVAAVVIMGQDRKVESGIYKSYGVSLFGHYGLDRYDGVFVSEERGSFILAAALERVHSALEAAARNYEQIDVFIIGHQNIITIFLKTFKFKHKIRFVYNTGCDNAEDGPGMIKGGYSRIYVGHPGTSASPLYFPSLVTSWVSGKSADEAIKNANAETHQGVIFRVAGAFSPKLIKGTVGVVFGDKNANIRSGVSPFDDKRRLDPARDLPVHCAGKHALRCMYSMVRLFANSKFDVSAGPGSEIYGERVEDAVLDRNGKRQHSPYERLEGGVYMPGVADMKGLLSKPEVKMRLASIWENAEFGKISNRVARYFRKVSTKCPQVRERVEWTQKMLNGGMPVIWTTQKFKTPSSYIVYGHKKLGDGAVEFQVWNGRTTDRMYFKPGGCDVGGHKIELPFVDGVGQ